MSSEQILEDKSSECLSAILVMETDEYLQIIGEVYKDRGGIKGQRAPLKTKTGIRIRKRMVEDISKGSILPPMVIGMVVNENVFNTIRNLNDVNDVKEIISNIDKDSISIIDGMQRTTAILEASETSIINKNPVRVEIWIAKSVGKLIYRMLVLNTGQVPWDIKRQLETIYSPIICELKNESPEDLTLLSIDDNSRRNSAGEYHSSKLIEYFLAFTSRKMNVDIREKVAEDFAKMDATEATASSHFLEIFKKALLLMVKLDKSFARYKPANVAEGSRFKNGKDIFTSAPACFGFITAVSIKIFGLPGYDIDDRKSYEKMKTLETQMDSFFSILNHKNIDQLGDFLDLLTLNEKLSIKTGKVGAYERDFFFKAFSTLLEQNIDLPSMYPCWSAH